MRILLVRVTADTAAMQGFYQVVRMEPLSLEYLGAAVRANHDVKLFDMRLEGGWDGLQKTIEMYDPHVVGTGGDTCEANACKKVLSMAKKHNREILTCVGGIHATTIPSDFLHPDIDIVCVNEGVFAFREIVEQFEKGGSFKSIHGIGINENGTQHLTPERPLADLDTLPFPDRSLTADVRGQYGFSLWGKHLALMRYTQGCVGKCDFCPSWTQTGGRYLRRSVESMLEEIKGIKEPYIYFVCEESLLDPKLSLALAKAIKEEGIDKHKHFGMPLRADTIAKRPHVIEAWADAGLTDTIVGLEQATDEHMEDREKTTTIQHNRDAMKILKANGVNCTGSMFFRPDFTAEQFDQLVAHTVEIEVDCPQYFVLTPIPGTKLYNKWEKDLVEHDFDLWDFNHAVTPTTLPLKDFYERYMLAYATHLQPFVVEFYQRKFKNMTQEELEHEVQLLEIFREVFGTLHSDHREYKGPEA